MLLSDLTTKLFNALIIGSICYLLRFRIKRRLLYLAFGVGGFLAAYSAGAAIPMTPSDAKEVIDTFMKQIGNIDAFGIFENNVKIALLMFVPAVGAGMGIFTGVGTGSVFSAFAVGNPQLGGISPLVILITPFGIMEVFCYGLAMSRSTLLAITLYKDKPWRLANRRPFFDKVLIPTFIEIGIVIGILFAAAMIEWAIIEWAGGLNTAIGNATSVSTTG